MPLQFTADLVVESADGLVGRVTGEGSTLRVTTDDPARFVDELRATWPADVRGVGRVGDFLAGEGVSVTISGPRGDVLTLGAEASSLVGRLTTGTRRVAPGRPLTVAPLVRGQVRDMLWGLPASPRARVTVGLVLATLAVCSLLRRRRRS